MPAASHERMCWRNAASVSAVAFAATTTYAALEHTGGDWRVVVSAGLAATAALLVESSLALSGFCYYGDFLDRKLCYRKYLGVIGFYYALAHALTLAILHPSYYIRASAHVLIQPEAVLGLSGLAILAFMTLISNRAAMIWLGGAWWRRCLRLGYLALLLFMIRALLLEGSVWIGWIHHPDGLPPLRLILFIIGIFALAMRVSMVCVDCIVPPPPAPGRGR